MKIDELKNCDAFELNLALSYAAMDGDINLVKLILTELKTDIDSVNSAFENACSKNKIELMNYLLYSNDLPHHADVKADNYSAFTLACEGNLEAVKILVPLLEFKNEEDKFLVAGNAMIKASEFGNVELIKYLLSEERIANYLDIENDSEDWLRNAGSKGHIEAFNYLLNIGNNKHLALYSEHTILEDIILNCFIDDKLDMVKYIFNNEDLKRNINLNSDEDYLFKFLCENGADNDIIRFLVFDLNIERTEEIQRCLIENNYTDFIKIFDTRDLNDSLKNEMSESDMKRERKPKI